MSFKCSICYSDNPEIEYLPQSFSASEVKKMVKNYAWQAKLQKMNNLNPNDINYSPSLEFTNQQDKHSFTLTVINDDHNSFAFSIWYGRPVMKKVLFGLLGEKEALDVIDKEFSVEQSYKLLDEFLHQNYEFIERKMNKTA